MTISIVIPTYNPGPATVAALCRALDSQRLAYHELIVVDSSSTDASPAWWPPTCRLTTIPKAEFDHGRTRNLGARLARGDILVFMTQDALPANEVWLEHLVAPLRQGEAVAAFARHLPRADAGPLEVFARHFNYPAESRIKSAADIRAMGVRAFFFSNVCSAVLAEAFWQVGGFPERSILNEDMILAAKLLTANHRIKYVAEAEVLHSHNYSLAQQFKRDFDIGVSIAQAGGLLRDARASGAGLTFVWQQLRYVVENGQPWLVPRVLVESGAKFLAFQLGRRERFLPRTFKRRLSMHSHYWDRLEQHRD